MNSEEMHELLKQKSLGKNNGMYGKSLTKEQSRKMAETKRKKGDYERTSERI